MPDDPTVAQESWEGNSSRGILLYKTLEELEKYPKILKKVLRDLISDIAARAPHHIGKAVSQRYAVGTLAAIKRRAPGSATKFSARGDTKLKVKGDYEKNLWLEFTGSVSSDWPTKANGKKKLPSWKKVRGSKRKGTKTRRVRQPYTLTREIIRGKWTPLIPRSQNTRRFALPRGKNLIPMSIAPGWPKPLALGGTSIPQAIIQPETVKLWEPNIFDLIDKRTAHAISRHFHV